MKSDFFPDTTVFIAIHLIFIGIIILILVSKGKTRKQVKKMALDITSDEHDRIKVYLDDIKGLNTIKIKCNILLALSIICALLFLIGTRITFLDETIYISQTFDILILVLAFILIKVRAKESKKYIIEYKKNVIKKVINELDSHLLYVSEMGVTEEVYSDSGLDHYDVFKSEDLINGKIEDLDFEMSDVLTQKVEYDSDGANYKTSFSGTFAHVNLKKYFMDDIYVSSVNNGTLYNCKKVLIDNARFNKVFVASSQNDITALRVLTPDITNKIIDFYDKTLMNLEIYISESNLYFRIHDNNLFEPSMKNEEDEIKNVYINICVFNIIRDVIKEIVKALNDLEV